MSSFLLILLLVLVGACFYGYRRYRIDKQKQAREWKRNQFNDRV